MLAPETSAVRIPYVETIHHVQQTSYSSPTSGSWSPSICFMLHLCSQFLLSIKTLNPATLQVTVKMSVEQQGPLVYNWDVLAQL